MAEQLVTLEGRGPGVWSNGTRVVSAHHPFASTASQPSALPCQSFSIPGASRGGRLTSRRERDEPDDRAGCLCAERGSCCDRRRSRAPGLKTTSRKDDVPSDDKNETL